MAFFSPTVSTGQVSEAFWLIFLIEDVPYLYLGARRESAKNIHGIMVNNLKK
jgi:hypothetical protein